MCGIYGVVNGNTAVNADIRNFVRQAMICGSLRGEDSTGILQLDKKKKTYILRQVMPGWSLQEDKSSTMYIKDSDESPVTLVHNRAATRGEITQNNAHPFSIYSPDSEKKHPWEVHGVHNGTLTSMPTTSSFKVDSEWALDLIAREDLKAFEKIAGSFCFVWTDSRKPGKLMMVRNSQRPMHFAYTDGGKRMLFASEHGMLAWLMDRNNLKIVDDVIYFLEPMVLYEFDTSKPRELTKTKIPEFKPSYPTSTTYSRTGKKVGQQVGNNSKEEFAIRSEIRNKMDALLRGIIKAANDPANNLTKEIAAEGRFAVFRKAAVAESEMSLAEDFDLLHKLVPFQPMDYIEDEHRLIGTIEVPFFGELNAEIRGLEPKVFDELNKAFKELPALDDIIVRVRGMYEQVDKDYCVIVSQPVPDAKADDCASCEVRDENATQSKESSK